MGSLDRLTIEPRHVSTIAVGQMDSRSFRDGAPVLALVTAEQPTPSGFGEHLDFAGVSILAEALHPQPTGDQAHQNHRRPDLPRAVVQLGALEVRPASRTLLVEGNPVDLGGRAFDLLMVLLEAHGEIVSKDDLLRQVWPTVTVVESNLKVQLCLLRRALGPESWRIKTISGRGYLLVADDARTMSAAPPPSTTGHRPLVIVVDADRGTQELVVRALSEVARYFDGVTRLALIPRDSEEQPIAC